ncbi:MAG: hypothetical protein AB7F50_01435 [Fimbriimonadaceae bacterium]
MRHLSTALVVAVLLGGCASRESIHAGTFEPFYTTQDGASTEVTGTTLELRPDGSFSQQGFPMIEGKWHVAGTMVVLQPLTKAGLDPKAAGLSKPAYDPIELGIDKDGTSLLDRPDPDGSRTVWRRK